MVMKNEDLFKRYSRQIYIEEIGIRGQQKIIDSKILVIGAGGLGSPVIQYLTAAGIGTLGVADFDDVELHNLNRQVIHSEESVGCSKVKSAAKFAKKLNSQVRFIAIEKKIDKENIVEIIFPFDIIIDASDNFSTRYLINDTCVQLNKPLVYGSILAFTGKAALFNYKGSKNLRDIFPEPPSEEDLPDCDTLGVLGPLPGIVGSMMANLTLNMITNLSTPINQLTLIDTFNWRFQQIKF